MTDVDAKFKLEDILNKQKAPPQILDLVHIKIETEEGYKKYIQKIPDYKIRPERVSLIWRANNSWLMKFSFSEKATKIEKISHLFRRY